MSGIDANYAGPFLQVPQQQNDASRLRDTQGARGDSVRRDAARLGDALDSTVETADQSTAVDNESEGLGSQGRPFRSPRADGAPPEDQAEEIVTHDDAGRPHVDVRA